MTDFVALARKTLADDGDVMDASAGGADLEWLVAQLACWPTRVDPDCTTSMRFLMSSAAQTLISLAGLAQEQNTKVKTL